MPTELEQVVEAIVRILRTAESLLFVTGAGISADSGIPTYRGIGGLYEVEQTDEGLPIEEILSGPTFRENPELTWKYLAEIALASRGARPNRAHEVIAALERDIACVWTLTQNVDGFHSAAGSSNVIEVHGTMRRLACTQCSLQSAVADVDELRIPPRCPECQAILRPDVVLFEEPLPGTAIEQLLHISELRFDAVFSIGTSGIFPYIQEPVIDAGRRGIPTIEINPCETVLSDRFDYRLELPAAEALDAIWRRFANAGG